MIFLVVGTQYPFDRLVRAIDEAIERGLVDEPVVGQIGRSGYRPRRIEARSFMQPEEFRQQLDSCRAVVAHAGVGTILEALDRHKPVLVLPRRAVEGEHVNDHQLGTAERLAQSGRIVLAREVDELEAGLRRLASFRPKSSRSSRDAVVRRVRAFLAAP